MDVKLNILDGSAHRFSKVVHLPCIIGRSRLSNISIVHPLVSRQHCEIYEDHGLVMVRDLGSLNGTFYKEVRIGRGIAIPYGEVFSIGTLHFVLEKIEGDTAKMAIGGDDQDEIEVESKNDAPAAEEAAAVADAADEFDLDLASESPALELEPLTAAPLEEIAPNDQDTAKKLEKPTSKEPVGEKSANDDDDLNFDDIIADLLG